MVRLFFRIFFVIIFFVTFFYFVKPIQTFAATFNCTTTTSGTWNWNTAANWSNCNSSYPGASSANTYNVAINSTTATTINLNTNVNYIGTLTIIGNGVAHNLRFNNYAMTTSGTVTINAPTTNNVTNNITVDSGTFTIGGDLVVTSGSAASRVSLVYVTTGTINVTGNITYGGTAAAARIVFAGNGSALAQNVGTGGLFAQTATTSASLKITGASPAIGGGTNYTYDNFEFAGSGIATVTGTFTVNGNFIITSGALDFGANTATITGTTEVKNGATAAFSSATGTKTFTGAITLDTGSTWDNSGNSAVTYKGGLTNNAATFNGGTGTQTFSTNNQTIGGTTGITFATMTITSITVISNYTSSSPGLTITTLLSGTGTLQLVTNGYLTVNSATITTLDAATNTPNTVEYNTSGSGTIKGTTYDYLIFSGTGTGLLGTTTTVNHDLTVTNGTFGFNGKSITVTGSTNVSSGGALTVSSTGGTKIFADVTIGSGSSLNFNAADGLTINGSLLVNGTGAITGTAGAMVFQGASGTIGGTANTSLNAASLTFTGTYAINFPITLSGGTTVTGVTVTNNTTLTIGTSLTGTGGTLVQGTNAALSIGTTSTITTLDASAYGNTVTYTGTSTQTIKVPVTTYYNLTYAGSSTGTLGGNVTINGNLAINSGTLASGNHNIILSGNFTDNGTFTPGTGTVTFVDPTQTSNISGTTTFYKLTVTTPNKSLVFTHGATTTVSNTVTITGQSCENPISLSSDSSGNPFTLTAPAGATISFVSVTDATSTNVLNATNATNVSGNSGGWNISGGICAGQTTAYSFQRKTFYDATHSLFWRFSYNGTQILGEYNISPWNTGWTTSSSIAANTNDFSIWYDGTYVFVAYSVNNDIMIRRGTPGASSITWGTAYTALNGTNVADQYLYPNISEDSSKYLWVTASYNNSITSVLYSVVTIKSSSAQDPSGWGSINTMATTNTTNADIYGVTVPLGSQNMLTLYEVNGTIYSVQYTNGSGYGTDTSITTSAATTIDKNFSVTTDNSNNVYLVLVDTSGFVQYYKYAGSWSAATRLDTSATNQYPSIAVDTSTGDLYIIYYRSSKIYYKIFHNSWGSELNTNWATDSTAMNSSLNYGDSGYIYGVWQTGSGSYAANLNNLLYPNANLSLSTPSSTTLSNVTLAATVQNSTGSLGATTVTDNRGTSPGWSLTVTVTNFSSGGHTIAATNFTINPNNGTITTLAGSGTNVTPGVQHTFSGTNDPANVMTASSGYGEGQYSINPDLSLGVPVGSYWGNYSATITETVQ